MATGTLHYPQRLEALELANEARLGAAQVKRELRVGVVTLGQALEDPRSGPVTIGDLICAQPRWGPTKMRKLLARATLDDCFVSETKRVRALTVRQRSILARIAVDIH